MTAIKLKKLLMPWCKLPLDEKISVDDICGDSRQVKANDVFLLALNDQQRAQQFIDEALTRNAAAIIINGEKENLTWHSNALGQQVPVIALPHLENNVGKIAADFFDNPAKKLIVAGFTGTNGKTSSSHFAAQIIEKTLGKCAVLGTLGVGFPAQLTPTNFTTPDAITLQRQIAQLQKADAKYLAMEVSSHALSQHRVAGMNFHSAIFTNLTRDHLDYHGNMENYGKAKSILFTWPHLKQAIVNLDDPFGRELLQKIEMQVSIYGYSQQSENNLLPAERLLLARNVRQTANGVAAEVYTPWGEGKLQANLLGRFSISNLLGVLASVCGLGVNFNAALEAIAELKTVPGRLQSFKAAHKPLVVVDYSHTPDALSKALQELKAHLQGKLWCVFGCGGDRDRGKRPIMGQIAEQMADHVIITDDNPRHENPAQIIDDILAGINKPKQLMIQHDRAAAITHAVNSAAENDIVLVAGKGHEDYQIIGDEKRHFSDIELVNNLISKG